jgi:hypothetical protein
MKLYEILLTEAHLAMSDADLAAAVRGKLRSEIEQKAEIARQKVAGVRKKLGAPIEIDGVRYDSRSQASKALGISHAEFVRRYGYVNDIEVVVGRDLVLG